MPNILENILPIMTTYGIRVIGVLIAIWISFKIAAWLQRKVTGGLRARKFDDTLAIFFGSLARWLLIIAAVLACLGVFGIQTTSFAAILGAAGLAVGLAFQGTLSNFSAGVMLLVFRPFKVGDLVTVGGQFGTVAELGLFVTALDTWDNKRIVVPNSAVASGVIENMTHHARRRVDVSVGVSYGADIDKTREVLDAAAASVPGRDPELGHQVFLVGLGASSVDWQVRVWTDPKDYFSVWEATVRAAKKALDAAGLPIPFPQMDVHLDGAIVQAPRSAA